MFKVRFVTIVFICAIYLPDIIGQEFTKRIISYDFESGQFDTLNPVEMSSEKKFDATPFMRGREEVPTEILPPNIDLSEDNLVPSTMFTKPMVATENFDIQKYPISTAVKLFNTNNGGRGDLCSGVMISESHVLSSAHCVFQAYTTNVNINSISAEIFFDVSLDEERTYSSRVKKIYFLEDWNISLGEDIAVFELEENIGSMSGWMSIGFNEDDSYFQNMHMHKLAYPAYNTPFNDYPFNGDTLYYSHGNIDFINDNFLGVDNHLSGVGGESGSAIFEHTQEDKYIAYGVLTWLGNYSHSRFNKERYYAFSNLISELSTSTHDPQVDIQLLLYPNPANSQINLRFNNRLSRGTITSIYDVNGRLLHRSKINHSVSTINIESLPKGMHYLHLTQDNQIILTKAYLKY